MTLSQDASLAEAGGGAAAPGLPTQPAAQRGAGRGSRHAFNYLGVWPFLAYVAVFLFWPTFLVASVLSVTPKGRRRSQPEAALTSNYLMGIWKDVELSLGTAVAGAILGGLLAWAIAEGRPTACSGG